jgi:hypothetical protein
LAGINLFFVVQIGCTKVSFLCEKKFKPASNSEKAHEKDQILDDTVQKRDWLSGVAKISRGGD